MSDSKLVKVLIAGIGGASLGTELVKCLKLAGGYKVYGCDVSPFAFGHYDDKFDNTHVISRNNYVQDILSICHDYKIQVIIPGGEEPGFLLSENAKKINAIGCILAMNSKDVVRLCADKVRIFNYLESKGIPIPKSTEVRNMEDLKEISYPVIIKPAVESGGSMFVYLAENLEDAELYSQYLLRKKIRVLAQKYLCSEEGEFSVGVLSLPGEGIIGSVAMKKQFDNKLSYTMKHGSMVISSPYSQGIVDEFKDVRRQAEKIAHIVGSQGPLNIQGRVEDGIFYPFEINARFSGGSYLRSMTGFNEVHSFLKYLVSGEICALSELKYGYFIRSLTEKFIDIKGLKE